MALLLKNGAIFLHIPKTGGKWVADVLTRSGHVKRKLSHKHCGIHQLYSPTNRDAPRTLKRFLRGTGRASVSGPRPYLFCFVRNPLSWYESWFRYMSQPEMNWRNYGHEIDLRRWHPNSMLNGLGAADFNQFIRNVIAKRPGYVTELYGWYTTPQVNFIGKQESIREDLLAVLKQMNLSVDESLIYESARVGASKTPRQNVTWDPALNEEVKRLEYAGLVRYGYADTAAETRAA